MKNKNILYFLIFDSYASHRVLNEYYSWNDSSLVKKLFDNGLISSSLQPVKVLGDGKIKKAIKIKATSFSQSAILKIEKVGGKIELQ